MYPTSLDRRSRARSRCGQFFMEMTTETVRELLLKRRRARLPWVYLVYHRHGRPTGQSGGSALAAKKRRDVERRGGIGVELSPDEAPSVARRAGPCEM